MPHVVPLRLLWAVLPLCAVGGGCDPDCATVEPAYAGDATDEAWRVMLDAKADADASDDVEVVSGLDVDAGASEFTVGFTSTLQVASASPRLPSFPRSRPRRDVVDRVRRRRLLRRAAAGPRAPAADHERRLPRRGRRRRPRLPRGCAHHRRVRHLRRRRRRRDRGRRGRAQPDGVVGVSSRKNRVTEGAFVTGPLTLTVE